VIVKKKKDHSPQVKENKDMKGVRFYPMLTARDGTPNFSMRLFEIGPGGYTPRHSHEWEHEVYVIKGDGHVFKDDEKTRIEKDDFIFVKPSELHQFCAGEKGMSIICVVPNKGQPS
jgi:quercetin dioxygenase-like cupin family protein